MIFFRCIHKERRCIDRAVHVDDPHQGFIMTDRLSLIIPNSLKVGDNAVIFQSSGQNVDDFEFFNAAERFVGFVIADQKGSLTMPVGMKGIQGPLHHVLLMEHDDKTAENRFLDIVNFDELKLIKERVNKAQKLIFTHGRTGRGKQRFFIEQIAGQSLILYEGAQKGLNLIGSLSQQG